METATIIFSNGETVTAQYNGSCFATDTEPQFPENLENITIEKESGEEHIAHGFIKDCASVDGRYWFTVREIPEQKRFNDEITAQIQYIAMMADIDLED